MSLRYDESEYVFCDLQAIYRYIRQGDEDIARRFLEAAYDSFEFLAENPMIGRARPEFAHADLRSWRVQGFRNYLIFTDREMTACKFGGCSMVREIFWR